MIQVSCPLGWCDARSYPLTGGNVISLLIRHVDKSVLIYGHVSHYAPRFMWRESE